MSVNTCPNCGNPMPVDATFCPECGHSAVGNTTMPQAVNHPRPSFGDSFKAVEQSKVFAVTGGFINLLDNSAFIKKPLLWLYIFFAGLNIIMPIYLLFLLISNNIMSMMGFSAFLIWLVVAFAGWMGFQLWWNRKDKIGRYYVAGDEYFATPLFSHLIQTIGEWTGITLAIIVAGTSVVSFVFASGRDMNALPINIPMQNIGIGGLIAAPILGFVIVLFFRVLAELYRALASIANNTKAMAGR